MKRWTAALVVACGTAVGGTSVTGAAWAGAWLGPPMVCDRIEVGEGTCPNFEKGSDRSGLVGRVTDALKTMRDPLVRMETLRRGAVAIAEGKDARELAWELLGRLSAIALEQEAAGKGDAQAWYDVGFLVGVFDQLHLDLGWRPGVADGINGYAYIRKGLAVAREGKAPAATVGAMEYGAALITLPEVRGRGRSAPAGQGTGAYDGHVVAAAKSAEAGSLLERNLSAHLKQWGTSIEQVRSKVAAGPK
jgi:hypothetical protein